MARELCEDLILEIIARLPLKYVGQCSVLNKSLYHRISDPSFAVFSPINNSIIFHSSRWESLIFSTISPHESGNPNRTETLDSQTSILASCNGLLLLRLKTRNSDPSYVFNPLTGGIAPLNFHIVFHHGVGLAVDLAANDYRVVTVDVDNNSGAYFRVISPRTGWTSRKNFVCDKFTLTNDKNIRSVYAHGCLHWLALDGRKILAFDVEKEEARILDGPVKETGVIHPDADSPWFGFADGSMHFILALPNEIVIHGHDCGKGEWRVKHKIDNISSPSNNDYKYGLPLLFDGRQVFVYIRKREKDGEVQAYDIGTKVWKRKGYVGAWSRWEQLFFSYFPTLVKVSDKYLHVNRLENAAHNNSLLKLRRLLI